MTADRTRSSGRTDKKRKSRKIARAHAVTAMPFTEQRKNSMACVALPTQYPLAMAEAERSCLLFTRKIRSSDGKHGLADDAIFLRTGCRMVVVARDAGGNWSDWVKPADRYNFYIGGSRGRYAYSASVSVNIHLCWILKIDALLGR